MASVPVKRLGEVEHGLEISLCRYQVQFRYDTVSDILFRYVIGRGETGAFENGELRIVLCGGRSFSVARSRATTLRIRQMLMAIRATVLLMAPP